jgi:WD40 repeat protein
MKPSWVLALSSAVGCLGEVPFAQGQGTPDIVWEAATPSGIANSIQGVGWAPDGSGSVSFGSTDRWVRTRRAEDGLLLYSLLQPLHSDSAEQTIYSADGAFIAVHNSGGGLGYRVHRAADGVFLGTLTVTVDTNGLVRFAPDAQLSGAVGGDGTLSRWRFEDFRVVVTVGSGYQLTNTTFNFSANGALQSAAKQGTITIRRRSDGAVARVLTGGLPKGVTPVEFTPDSSGIAAWAANPNRVTLWRISDGMVLMNFPEAAPEEGVGAIRFTRDGAGMVTTGYLPFVDKDGLWQQKGMIRFWRVADGTLRQFYDTHTSLGVTSPVAWSPDSARFAYGTYEGSAVVARTPAEFQATRTQVAGSCSLEILPNGNGLLRQSGVPGTGYHVEASTNLLTWRELCVVTVNSNGYCEFLDTNSHGFSRKFYRSWHFQ